MPEGTASELVLEPVAEELRINKLVQGERKLEEDRREFEREKREFYFRKKMEEKRLTEEKRLFQMKWKILEGELQNLAREKKEMAMEKEQYTKKANKYSAYSVSCDSSEAEMFFSGVDNELALKKRYKELIKIYHPDNAAGDTGTLQMINKTYDLLKKQFTA